MFKKSLKKSKGFTISSVLIGGLIASALSLMAISDMWGSVDSSKVKSVANSIKAQQEMISAQKWDNFGALEGANISTFYDNKIWDYKVEAEALGFVSKVPSDYFKDTAQLAWEIRTLTYDNKRVFYATLESGDIRDQELIEAAVLSLGKSDDLVNANYDVVLYMDEGFGSWKGGADALRAGIAGMADPDNPTVAELEALETDIENAIEDDNSGAPDVPDFILTVI